jgi:outer membrane protein
MHLGVGMCGFFGRLKQGTVAFGLAASATIATVGAGVADSLHSAMADAYVSSPLLEQNRFLLRIDDEGVAQAVAQLRPTLSFVASTNRDLVADDHDHRDGRPRRRVGPLCRQWTPGWRSRRRAKPCSPRARASSSVEQQVLLDAVTAYLNVWRDLQVVERARGQRARRHPAAARRARPVRGGRGHPHRRRPGRGAAGPGPLRPRRRPWGSLQISRELFALAVGRHPGALSGPGPLPGLPRSEAEADALARQNAPYDPASCSTRSTASRSGRRRRRARRLPPDDHPAGPRHATHSRRQTLPCGEGEGASIGLTLTQPIYRGGQLAALERQARAQACRGPRHAQPAGRG